MAYSMNIQQSIRIKRISKVIVWEITPVWSEFIHIQSGQIIGIELIISVMICGIIGLLLVFIEIIFGWMQATIVMNSFVVSEYIVRKLLQCEKPPNSIILQYSQIS